MSRAEEPTKNDSAQVRALVNRQVQAWEKRDSADDWLPNGELFSPGGHVVKKDMQSAILDYFKSFTDLKVTVNEMFLSEDGTRLAIQWDPTYLRFIGVWAWIFALFFAYVVFSTLSRH